MSTSVDRGPGHPVVTITVTHVTDDEVRIAADPDPAQVWYGYEHHRMSPHAPDLPHELVIHVLGLRPGEALEIQLASITAHIGGAQAGELLRTIFPTAAPAHDTYGWRVPFGTSPIRTGNAWSQFGNVARIRLKYDLVVYRDDTRLGWLDPDVHLEPDP